MAQHPADPEGSAAITDLSAVRLARQQSGVPKPRVAPRVANRRFNAEKVGRLKRQIEQGRYTIDPYSTADRFIEHERNRR